MSQRFSNKTVLVTGGGTGIGAAVAKRFVSEGARVCVAGRRKELLDTVVAELADGDAIAVACDLTDAGQVAELASAALEFGGGRVDVLVNNAAASIAGSIEELELDDWATALAVNLTAPMLLMRALAPAMREAGGGSIINISSLAGLHAAAGLAPYCTTKAALNMLTQQVAIDLGPSGIRVNSICPGWVRTAMSEEQMDRLAPVFGSREAAFARVSRHQALPRIADPDEIASVAAFLASTDASYITGAVMPVDGGSAMVDAATTPIGDLVRGLEPAHG